MNRSKSGGHVRDRKNRANIEETSPKPPKRGKPASTSQIYESKIGKTSRPSSCRNEALARYKNSGALSDSKVACRQHGETSGESETKNVGNVFTAESPAGQEVQSRTSPNEQHGASDITPGAFAIQGQSIEQRGTGFISPVPEEQTPAQMEHGRNELSQVLAEIALDVPLAAEVPSEDDFEARVRRVLAQDTVPAENVAALENDDARKESAEGDEGPSSGPSKSCRTQWKRPAVIIACVFLVVAVVVGVTVAVVVSSDDKDRTPTTTLPPVDSPIPTVQPVPGGRWQQLGQDLHGKSEWDKAGLSVSLSEDSSVVAVGAPGLFLSASSPGYVLIYQHRSAPSTWSQMGQELSGEYIGDNFGFSVALSSTGNIVAIGAIGSDGNGSESGSIHVYQYNPDTLVWYQMGESIIGETVGGAFGNSVSLSEGGILAAGVWSSNANLLVYKYDSTALRWIRMGQDLNCEDAVDELSVSVSLNRAGDTVAVGGSKSDDSGAGFGYVCVYQYNGDTFKWEQMGETIDGEVAGDTFHVSVSLSGIGNDLAVGWSNRGVGVYHYYSNRFIWEQMGRNIVGESNDDWFGLTVSLARDGHVLAAGAPANNGNGINSGSVRVYNYDAGTLTWTQVGQDIDGENTEDYSGASVSLCGNGTAIAIGAPDSYGNIGRSGQARVYTIK